MKKKKLIIASILGATAFIAGASAVTIITSNAIKSKEVESSKLEESTLAEDELFGGELPSLIATKKVQKAEAPAAALVSPVIGRQYAYDEVAGTVSIRFYAAITSLDVDAVWTRTLYNADGSVNNALAAVTKKSTVAYETLNYKEGGDSKQLNATDVEAEDGTKPFKYFVLYTLKNVNVSTYGECTIDAYVEISNAAEAVVSKTGSVTTTSTAEMSSYTLDLDMNNTYQGSNTKAGNGQYINGKVKTIYTMSDTAIDTTNLEATLYKNGVEQPKTAKTTTLSFKGDTANEASNYLVYADQAISSNPGLTLGMFTILDNGKGVVADNGDWLKFNAGGKVKFTLASSAKLSISFYQDNNNVKVYVGDTEVAANSDGSYSLSAGNITIEAVSSGYLGKIIVEEKELVTASGFNAGVAGMQTITAKYKNASATYNIYVVDTAAYQDANNNYVVTVDKSYTGEIGEISGTNGNMFTTISQALEFLQNSSIVPASANKILNIGAGYYYEKLEITTPNLTINGSGTIAKGTYASDVNYDADDFLGATVIEFDTLYGVTDTNGFVHTTDSTQTVAIRETATNCTINGVTISNKWNCKAYFDAKGVSSEHRALALLVQADQFVMNNSSLLGYQDTLELFTGRQYFSSCYISGATDYIFGTNNTTLFNGCEIHSIYTGNGGFINAFKGCNYVNTIPNYVDYGVIYNKCNFTADSGVSNTSIARSWESYSTVAIIDSVIGSHVSTAPYTSGATQNQRYVAWTNQGQVTSEPTTSTVRYYEYGNTGSGAISESQTGVTYLDADTAADYSNLNVVFAKTNGEVTYSSAWNPIVIESSMNFVLRTGSDNDNISTAAMTIQNENTLLKDGLLELDARTGKLSISDNEWAQFNKGTKISFYVKAGATVTVSGYKDTVLSLTGENDTTLANSGDSVTHTYTADTKVTIEAKNSGYISGIRVSYLTYIEENTVISFGSNGNYKDIDGLTYTSVSRDNGGTNSQLGETNGEISFYVRSGATITISSYSGYTAYTISADGVTSAEQTGTSYSITAINDGKVMLKSTNSNNYLYSISITYPSVIKNDLTISFAKSGNAYDMIEGVTKSCTITDCGSYAQVKNGTITLSLKANAKVTVNGYWGLDVIIGETVVKNTNAGGTYEGTSYVYNATAGDLVITMGTSGSNYLESIVVEY